MKAFQIAENLRNYQPSNKGSVPDKNDPNSNVKNTIDDIDSFVKEANRLGDEAETKNLGWDSDTAKYVTATELANSRLSGYDDITDDRMREEIDSIYSDLGGKRDPNKIRGYEDWGIVDQASDFINDGVRAGGNFLNDVFDTVVGSGADLVDGLIHGEDKAGWGDYTRNLFDGKDAEVVADIMADAAISLIPYAGIPLVVAKNALQNTDDIKEIASGRDSVTGEDLGLGQKAAKGIGAALSTGLSAVPGVGKVLNKKAVNEAVDEGFKVLNKADLQSAPLKQSDETIDAIDDTIKALKNPKQNMRIIDEKIDPKEYRTVVKPISDDNLIGPKTPEPSKLSIDKASVDKYKNAKEITDAHNRRFHSPRDGQTFGDVIKTMAKSNIDEIKRFPKEYKQQFKEGTEGFKELVKRDPDKIKEINEKIDDLKDIKGGAFRRSNASPSDKRAARDEIAALQKEKSANKMHVPQAIGYMINHANPATMFRGSPSAQMARAKSINKEFEKMDKGTISNKIRNKIFRDGGGGKENKVNNIKRPGDTRTKRFAANAAGLALGSTLADIGEYGSNPAEAINNTIARGIADPGRMLLAAVPFGATKAGRRRPGPNGTYGTSALNSSALRSGAFYDDLNRMYQEDTINARNEDEYIDYLRGLRISE